MSKLFEKEMTVKTKRVIEVEKIEDTNLVKYLDKRTIIRDNEQPKETCVFGVTSLDNTNSIKDFENIKNIVSTPKAYQGESTPIIILEDDYNKLMNGEIHVADAVKDIENEEDLNKGKLFYGIGVHTNC